MAETKSALDPLAGTSRPMNPVTRELLLRELNLADCVLSPVNLNRDSVSRYSVTVKPITRLFLVTKHCMLSQSVKIKFL